MVNEDVKELWLNALRSGKYEQGTMKLAQELYDGTREYCCLGVLCDLAVKNGVCNVKWVHGTAYYGTEEEFANEKASENTLPKSVQEWIGVNSDNIRVSKKINSFDDEDEFEDVMVSELNDEYGYSFDRIARLIKEQL